MNIAMNPEMPKIVHFDLKGAPPKRKYFAKVLSQIKAWGATGVLLEWEDTFPYTGWLSCIGSEENSGGDQLYSMDEVLYIINLCKELGLEVIQLVQTVGHMEFVLKHPKFKELNECHTMDGAICTTKSLAKELIREMIKQVAQVQPDAKYFHVGGDEAVNVGVCESCIQKVFFRPMDCWKLYLQHMQEVISYVKECLPNVTVLMWDDRMRCMDPEYLKGYNMGDIVQPVVWNYNVKEEFYFLGHMWEMYKECFPAVWAGSAFKGANGMCTTVIDEKHYLSNQEAWMTTMKDQSNDINFVGIILTGWSRFNHYATLCELLPSSISSLAACLRFWVDPEQYSEDLYKEEVWQPLQHSIDGLIKDLHSAPTCPNRKQLDELVTSHLNPWQLQTGFINVNIAGHIDNLAQMEINMIHTLGVRLHNMLMKLSGPRTASEFVYTHTTPLLRQLEGIRQNVKDVRQGKECPVTHTVETEHPT